LLDDVAVVRNKIGVHVEVVMTLLAVFIAQGAAAQNVDRPEARASGDVRATADAVTSEGSESNGADSRHPANDRIFGVLPNYSTVERDVAVPPLTASEMFRATFRNSFDPYVFPFVAVVVGFGQGGNRSYVQRYATSLADNSIGNVLTSAILPTLLHQDPRYYTRGTGRIAGRMRYAFTRSLVTRSAAGRSQFNASELVGNLSAAVISNAYYPSGERSLTGTLTRWGSQVMWDTVANELKEFWPDLKSALAAHRHPVRAIPDTPSRQAECGSCLDR
jgi:hypothetical protein